MAGQLPGQTPYSHGILVQEPKALLETLRRLHAGNDGIVFWNHERSFKLMLRNDPCDDDDHLAFELLMIFDGEDDRHVRMMELHREGHEEEPGIYIIDDWTWKAGELDEREAAGVAATLNRMFLTKICPCGDYLIKDDGAYCAFCQMTAGSPDLESHFCSICCDHGIRMHMLEMPCCQQHLHRRCLVTWQKTSGNDRCPLCRQMPV